MKGNIKPINWQIAISILECLIRAHTQGITHNPIHSWNIFGVVC